MRNVWLVSPFFFCLASGAFASQPILDVGRPQPGKGSVPYVIVTSQSLAGEFRKLAKERTRGGVHAVVRSAESILEAYPDGVDEPERIRQFLIDAHRQWNARWVLLGGDVDIVPARFVDLEDILGHRHFASDLYYGGLDGNWDRDGDGLFGELPDLQSGSPGDDPDLDPELYVGRAPVRDHHEAQRFVEKTLRAAARDSRVANLLVFAPEHPLVDLAAGAEGILQPVAGVPDVQVTRLYADHESWPGASPLSWNSFHRALEMEHDVALGVASCGPEAVVVVDPDTLLTIEDASALPVTSHPGQFWLLGPANDISRPTSLGEALVRARGGPATCLAFSDVTFFTLAMQAFHRIVQRVFVEHDGSIGEAIANAAIARPFTRMSMLLLGDPYLPVSGVGPGALPDPAALFATSPSAPWNRPETGGEPAASRVHLDRPRPNPASEGTRLTFSIPPALAALGFELAIFDPTGRRVRSLGSGQAVSGTQAHRWDLRDESGRRVRNGVYLARLSTAGHTITRTIVVLR